MNRRPAARPVCVQTCLAVTFQGFLTRVTAGSLNCKPYQSLLRVLTFKIPMFSERIMLKGRPAIVSRIIYYRCKSLAIISFRTAKIY